MVAAARTCIDWALEGCEDDFDLSVEIETEIEVLEFNATEQCFGPCSSEPCMHDGVCTQDLDTDSYLCECEERYNGTNCEIGGQFPSL